MTADSKTKCIKCNTSGFHKSSTLWQCIHCSHVYTCVNGMPKLYNETELATKDKSLRDYFYNGLIGKLYQKVMPFLTLPARPINKSGKDWLFYLLSVLLVITSVVTLFHNYSEGTLFSSVGHIGINLACIGFLLFAAILFVKHSYLFFLYLLAIPAKISLLSNKYRAAKGFQQAHAEIINKLLLLNRPLKILDISTGTGNSLFRHGWMKLDAEYTGLDLSETMLSQCQSFFAKNKIAVDLIVGDATTLPFCDAQFDVVLNYGAINGYGEIKKALAEMSRVLKSGGLMLFLDEQLYDKASFVEKLYFKYVLSSHNTIHHCPVELLPANVENIEVNQVYEFYYICTCYKK